MSASFPTSTPAPMAGSKTSTPTSPAATSRPAKPLLTIYSPELVATQQEFLLALKARRMMRSSSVAGTISDTDSMVDAARQRLKHWEVTDDEIDELERTGKVNGTIPLAAHHSGYIVDRKAFPHQKVTADMDLYMLADLSLIWVVAGRLRIRCLANPGRPMGNRQSRLPTRPHPPRQGHLHPAAG